MKQTYPHLSIWAYCLLLFASNAHATTYTFNVASGDWNVASNWQGNAIPPNPIPTGDIIDIPREHTAIIPSGYTLTNNGTIAIAQISGMIREGHLLIYGTLDNSGEISTGRMEVYGTYNHNPNATMTLGGTIYARGGGIFNIGGTMTGNFSLSNLGTMNILPTGSLQMTGTFTNIGTLVNDGTTNVFVVMWDNQTSLIKGKGTFSSNFSANTTTASTIAPGNSPGCLNFSNNFTNSQSIHKLKVQIDGTTPCTGFSKIIVGGTATVGGVLEANFGYTPTVGQTFQVIQAGAIAGSFSTVTVTPTSITATYSAGTLTVTSVLAAELVDFNAFQKNKSVHLNWQTASETNNKGFDIERSTDGKEWQSVGFVPSLGTTVISRFYSFEDLQPLQGVNYYRLRLMDNKGDITFSKIKSIEIGAQSEVLKVYPNPATDNFTIELPTKAHSAAFQLEIFDTFGRTVVRKKFDAKSANALITLDKLNTGLYQIRLTDGYQVWVNRLLVER
jgi:Secretion system C-terminal sorting domain